MAIPESKVHIEEDIEERSDELWDFQYPIRNQEYVVMSIIEANDKHPPAVKVFGTFATIAEANSTAQKISKQCDFFNVYTAQTQAWLPCPPSAKFVEDIEYQENKLEDMKKMHAQMKERDATNLRNQMERDAKKKEEAKKEKEASEKMALEDVPLKD